MGAMASQINSLTIVCSTVYEGADQRKHQSSASLAFVLGIHRAPVNSPHKWPVTRKMFPFDEVIMLWNQLVFIIFKLNSSGLKRVLDECYYKGMFGKIMTKIKLIKLLNNDQALNRRCYAGALLTLIIKNMVHIWCRPIKSHLAPTMLHSMRARADIYVTFNK